MVSFWILSRFGPRRDVFAEPLVKLRERRPRAVSTARAAAADATRCVDAVAALRDAWSSRVGLERWRRGRGQERSASLRCAARGRRRAAVNGSPIRHRGDACGVEPSLGCAGCRGMQSRAALLVKQSGRIATWPRCDVLQAPLWMRGDRCGSLDSIALAAAHEQCCFRAPDAPQHFVSLDSG